MIERPILITAALLTAVLASGGCHQVERVFYIPGSASFSAPQRDVILAADFGQVQQAPDAKDRTDRPPEPPGEQPKKEEEPSEDAPLDEQADDEKRETGYTAPRAQFQGLVGLVLGISSFGFSGTDSAGRELAEAGAMTTVVGRPGLAAPQPTAVNAVVGRPGLQQGFASSLGFGSLDRNIFTARFNPTSGAMGRCQELVGVGFFGGSRSACESHFRR